MRLPLEVILATANPIRQAGDKFRCCLFAVRAHQRRERGEQRGVGQCEALDPVVFGAVPGFRQILERKLPPGAVAIRTAAACKVRNGWPALTHSFP